MLYYFVGDLPSRDKQSWMSVRMIDAYNILLCTDTDDIFRSNKKKKKPVINIGEKKRDIHLHARAPRNNK